MGRVAIQDRSRPVAWAASVISCETRPVLILATGLGFATRPWSHVGPSTTGTTKQNSSHRQRMKFNSTREAVLSMCIVHSPTCSTHDSRATHFRQWLQHHVTINCSKYHHRLSISLLCCGYMWNKIILKIMSVFYFACNHVWNWNKIISAAEGVVKLFQRQRTCWNIFMSCNKPVN